LSSPDSNLKEIARGFIDALDDGRWGDAAALVAPSTVDAFREGWLAWLRYEDSRPTALPGPPMETFFASPLSLLNLRSASEAERLNPADLLARYIERMQPGNFPIAAGPESGPLLRVVRTLVGVTRTGEGKAVAEYRVTWVAVGHSEPWPGGVHRMHLAMTPDGWRVTDADVGGHGTGHLDPRMRVDSSGEPLDQG
jgi:hypothetical protein